MNEPLRRQEEIFTQALALPAAEREAYLNQACAGDAALRRHLEELLQAHLGAGSFLGAPPALAPEIEPGQPAPGEATGDRIGRYTLIQKLGEGGAGVVYEAEQEEPVRRRVALKLLKPGMDTAAAIRRFEAERQTLALMEHPNIAQVFDAGSTANGRLYFAMELVRGTRITQYCDDNRLPTAERLGLFAQVCRAVQHAHQKGIIHRDLKPSNVLVTVVDGVAVPKVIDFGIAKAVEGRLADQTALTRLEQVIGTPAYMSPEQATAGSGDIDTRSDIYSLGVLLYELLTGRTPFDTQELLRAGLGAMQQAIREREPPRPSTRLSTTADGELATIAAHRGAEPPKLIHQVRGDLDWIVMKALEKDRGRRYATANEFAADVERHLHDEPVVARPPSSLYQFQKYVRRHKTAAAALAAVLVALTAGLITTLIGFRRAVAAQREAERQRLAAVSAMAESDAAAGFLADTLASPSPARLGYDVTVRKVLDLVAPTIEKEFGGRPLLEARLREMIGRTYGSLAMGREAEPHLRRAVAIRLRELGPTHALTLRAQTLLAAVANDDKEGEKLLAEALAAYGTGEAYPAQDVVSALRLDSGRLAGERRLDAALAQARRAVDVARARLTPTDREAAWAQVNLAVTHYYRDEIAAARDAHYAVLALNLPPENTARGYAVGGVGIMELQLGQYAAAESHLREAVEFAAKFYGPDHPMTSMADPFMGMAMAHLGRAPQGLEMQEKFARLQIKRYGENSYAVKRARALMVYALDQVGRREEAVAFAQPAWEAIRKRTTEDKAMYDVMADVANVEVELGRNEDAASRCREVLGLLTGGPLRPYTLSRIHLALARALAGKGQFADAERELAQNDAMLAACTFDVREQRRLSATALVAFYDAWGKPEQARVWQTKLDSLPKPE